MEETRIECHQCEWSSCIRPGRIPLYGARIRCPECGSFQFVASPSQESDQESPGDDFVIDPIAETPRVQEPDLSERQSILSDSHPQMRPDEKPQLEPVLIPASEATDPMVEEARNVITTWLFELQYGEKEPLTTAELFTDHSEELAQIFALWKATHPGEKAIRLFREQLLIEVATKAAGRDERPMASGSEMPIQPEEKHDRA